MKPYYIYLTFVLTLLTGANSAYSEINNREKVIKDQSGSDAWEKVLERHTDFKRLDKLDVDPLKRHKEREKKLREPAFGTREYYRIQNEEKYRQKKKDKAWTP